MAGSIRYSKSAGLIKPAVRKAFARQFGVVPTIPKESDDQATYFDWLKTVRVNYKVGAGLANVPLFDFAFAVPNGSMLAGDSKQRAKYMAFLRRRGLKPGVSDIVIALPIGTYHGMYLELKRLKGGVVTKEQRDWQALMLRVGYLAVIARGFEAAKSATLNYLAAAKS